MLALPPFRPTGGTYIHNMYICLYTGVTLHRQLDSSCHVCMIWKSCNILKITCNSVYLESAKVYLALKSYCCTPDQLMILKYLHGQRSCQNVNK